MLWLIPELNTQTRQQNSDEEICCKILNLIKFCKVSCNVVLIHNPDAQIYLHDLRQINYYRWCNMMDSAVIPNENIKTARPETMEMRLRERQTLTRNYFYVVWIDNKPC